MHTIYIFIYKYIHIQSGNILHINTYNHWRIYAGRKCRSTGGIVLRGAVRGEWQSENVLDQRNTSFVLSLSVYMYVCMYDFLFICFISFGCVMTLTNSKCSHVSLIIFRSDRFSALTDRWSVSLSRRPPLRFFLTLFLVFLSSLPLSVSAIFSLLSVSSCVRGSRWKEPPEKGRKKSTMHERAWTPSAIHLLRLLRFSPLFFLLIPILLFHFILHISSFGVASQSRP